MIIFLYLIYFIYFGESIVLLKKHYNNSNTEPNYSDIEPNLNTEPNYNLEWFQLQHRIDNRTWWFKPPELF